nr:MAG TPA: ABC transporter, substrate-binding protein transporter [Caudoviricetes sp.]
MMKKLMSLGLAGILSASLLVGCSSNNDSKDDDTVTIKYVDENGNVKREKVTKDEAKQIERKQQTTDTTKKEQTTKEQPKDEDDMTDDEMQEKGLIKKNGGHLEDEAKKQEKIHEQEDQEQQGKYPISYDEDGTQINDENGNYTPEYEQKKQEEWNRHENYDDDEDYPNKDVHDSCIDPEDTTNTDNDVEESPSETIENN